MGRAKSHAERLFEFVPLEGLAAAAAGDALRVPVMCQGVDFTQGAIPFVLEQSRGYPYFPGVGKANLEFGPGVSHQRG